MAVKERHALPDHRKARTANGVRSDCAANVQIKTFHEKIWQRRCAPQRTNLAPQPAALE